MTAPPPWLVGLQADLGALLRAPLDPSSGTFRAVTEAYDPALLAQIAAGGGAGPDTPEGRLAVYHRQRWTRLFDGLQKAWPRSARVLGYWRFNLVVSRHLTAHPPAHPDLDRAADGLEGPLRAADGADLLADAVTADAAERRATLAAWTGVWAPRPADLAGLDRARLRFAPSFSLVRERWALAALPHREGPPAHHPAAAWHVYTRSAEGTVIRRVEPGLARLLLEAQRGPFGAALAAVEAEVGRDVAEQRLQAWIALALGEGWWVGLVPEAPR